MNESYSKGWDKLLNHLMTEHKDDYVFGNVNPLDGKIHTINFGDFVVWIENYPYAFGTPYEVPGDYVKKVPQYRNVRPSRLTIQRLHTMINNSKIEAMRAVSVDVGFKLALSELLDTKKERL
jgi:hypothetical protein